MESENTIHWFSFLILAYINKSNIGYERCMLWNRIFIPVNNFIFSILKCDGAITAVNDELY